MLVTMYVIINTTILHRTNRQMNGLLLREMCTVCGQIFSTYRLGRKTKGKC